MLKLAVYGKGGIGKSTISSNLSACFAKQGKKVLHVGCDPKRDSTLPLIAGAQPDSMAEILLMNEDQTPEINEFLHIGFEGIECVEAGGPEPGIGCAGWGISRTLAVFDEVDLWERNYDVVMLDVLGDVVCGGFATPMKKGLADSVVIVVSEEVMAIYAANNICKAIERLQANGVRLGGIVVNRRSNETSLAMIEQFAERIGTSVLATIPRSPDFAKAELAERTLADFNPQSEAAKILDTLSIRLAKLPEKERIIPKPMALDEFRAFVRSFA